MSIHSRKKHPNGQASLLTAPLTVVTAVSPFKKNSFLPSTAMPKLFHRGHMKTRQVNGGAVEVAETFLKALPAEEGNALPPTTPSAVVVDDGSSGGGAAAATAGTAAAAEAGGGSGGGGTKQPAATTKPQQRFRPIALIKEDRAAELREVLREMLIEFLELCRQLVLKTRTVLNIPRNAPVVAPRAVGEERTAEEVRLCSGGSWCG